MADRLSDKQIRLLEEIGDLTARFGAWWPELAGAKPGWSSTVRSLERRGLVHVAEDFVPGFWSLTDAGAHRLAVLARDGQ